MNTEQTSKNIFTHIKMHYGEIVLAKIRKLEKTMIQLRFSLRCHHSKILARWWERYLSKCSLIKHPCSLRNLWSVYVGHINFKKLMKFLKFIEIFQLHDQAQEQKIRFLLIIFIDNRFNYLLNRFKEGK